MIQFNSITSFYFQTQLCRINPRETEVIGITRKMENQEEQVLKNQIPKN